MTFAELLQLLNADAHLDINAAIESGGCTIRYDDHIDITLENHESHVYLFSPVMQTTQTLTDDFLPHSCKSIYLVSPLIAAGLATTQGASASFCFA
ncbi:hypothetical protein SODG_002067 [Sodalis praecaptivus]